jgi:HK97 family phage major capsid protein
MKKSDELLQKRSAVEDSIQALAEKADLTSDERETLRGLHAQVEKLTADIDLERKNEEILKRVADRNASSAKRQDNETRSYSIAKAIQDIVMRGKLDGLEAEMHQEALRETPSLSGFGIPSMILAPQKRADLVAAASKLVPTETVGFIEALRARLVLAQAGAVIMTGLSGNVSMPRGTGGAGDWEGEVDANADFSLTIDDVTLTPHRYGAFQSLTKTLLIQSPYNVEQIIRTNIIADIQRAVDAAGINGSGGAPTGILQTNGIGSTVGGADGLAPTWDNIIELEREVAVDNADLEGLKFLTNPKVRAKLRNTVIGTDQKMIYPEVGNMILGYDAMISTLVPSNLTKGNGANLSAIIFGNFNDLLIGQFGAFDVVVDQYTNAKNAKIDVVVNSWWDVAVKHAQSFSAMKDAVTV